METDLAIAKTIKEQLGHKALVMIGTKAFAAGSNWLRFKIGRNPGGWTLIQIWLNGTDLYDVEFYKIRKFSIMKRVKHENIYFDGLHELIETETGLCMSLGTMGGEG